MDAEALRNAVLDAARFVTFTGAAFVVGMLPVSRLVLLPGLAAVPEKRWVRARQLLAHRISVGVDVALGGIAVATALLVVVTASSIDSVQKTGFGSALTTVLGTSFGQWTLLRLPLVAALALILHARVGRRAVDPPPMERPLDGWWYAWAVLGVALVVTLPMSGHAAASGVPYLAVPVDASHLLAGGTWACGVALLAVVLPAAWRDKTERAQLQLLAPLLQRFSRLAVVAIGLAALTGAVSALLDVGSFSALRGTSYGQTLVVKLWLFAWVLALGGANHFFLIGRLTSAAARRRTAREQTVVATSLAGELLFGVLLLATTAVLVSLPKPG